MARSMRASLSEKRCSSPQEPLSTRMLPKEEGPTRSVRYCASNFRMAAVRAGSRELFVHGKHRLPRARRLLAREQAAGELVGIGDVDARRPTARDVDGDACAGELVHIAEDGALRAAVLGGQLARADPAAGEQGKEDADERLCFMRRFSFGRAVDRRLQKDSMVLQFCQGRGALCGALPQPEEGAARGAAGGRGREVQKFHKGAHVSLTNGFFACIMSGMKARNVPRNLRQVILYRGESSGCVCA